ncbi:MAG TPA: methylated-DNA--[protein]-cysteine S-methyltransferase [Stellaceae bacterium]|nr:methylated-DNA--[protein]-cysteine S-methyltransferase [Stellaceae bacterium]
MPRLSVASPLGPLTIVAENDAIVAIEWRDRKAHDESPLLRDAERQLGEYFAGTRRTFDLPLAPAGEAFDQRVWELMAAIPYGETQRYGELAQRLDAEAQAIGEACGRNPLPIFIPCHRVVAHNGLGGYSGGKGIETKRRLLVLEGALLL